MTTDPSPHSDPVVASLHVGRSGQSGRTHSLTELASGIDALYLSARADLPTAFVERLEYARSWATEVGQPAPCPVGDTVFGIAAHGWGKYRYCLDLPMARLGFSVSRHLPSVRVQPRAEYLHSVGPAEAVDSFRRLLHPDLGEVRFGVSRVDVFSDWQGWDLSVDDGRRFVCRADVLRTYEVGGTLTGFEFGSRKTKTFTGRIYDKTADIAAKGTGWWVDVWGERYVAGTPVHRVEVEVGRQGLVELGLDTPTEVLGAAGDIWSYGTGQWLTHRTPTCDRTRSRWPISSEWTAVQRATLAHRPVALERLRCTRRATSIRNLMPGLTGYLAAFAAHAGTHDIEDTLTRAGDELRNYEIVSRTPFHQRVERRRLEQELR